MRLDARRSPPMYALIVGVLLLLLLLMAGAAATWLSYRDVHAMVAQELELRFLSGQLLAQREQLSKTARLAVETGQTQWIDAYRRAEPAYVNTLRRVVSVASDGSIQRSPLWAAGAAATQAEQAAFVLLRQGRHDAALAMLSDPQYQGLLQQVETSLADLSQQLLQQGRQRLRLQQQQVAIVGVLGLALLLALAAAWLWISGMVRQYLQIVADADAQLAESNRTLDARVQSRTEALQKLNSQLRDEMEQRSKVEIELRQAQKLEAIGRLAAGVAHEINTPIQFASDNCFFLKQSVEDVCGLVEGVDADIRQAASGVLPVTQLSERFLRARKQADWDFLAEQMPQSVAHALDGLKRVATIVRSLKEYAHPGKGQRKMADINHILTSTLTIANSELKSVAQVSVELGEVPMVACYASELSQVILNLLVNAGHAIAARSDEQAEPGQITLRTGVTGHDVWIAIQDNGCGIPDTIREQIFDPFFTTKEVGKGTGQGLALARAIIVDQHQGQLELDSVVGRGSTFTIRLPQVVASPVAAAVLN